MAPFLKNTKKQNDDMLTLSFFRELSKKKEGNSKKIVRVDSDSNEIAEIISDRLLKEVQKQIVLK
jgi:hypothetical protein